MHVHATFINMLGQDIVVLLNSFACITVAMTNLSIL